MPLSGVFIFIPPILSNRPTIHPIHFPSSLTGCRIELSLDSMGWLLCCRFSNINQPRIKRGVRTKVFLGEEDSFLASCFFWLLHFAFQLSMSSKIRSFLVGGLLPGTHERKGKQIFCSSPKNSASWFILANPGIRNRSCVTAHLSCV